MADVDGYEVVITPFASAEIGSRGLDFVEGVAGAGDILYVMEAIDSVTGVSYKWSSTTADYNGDGYPGPNSPTQIAVSQLKNSKALTYEWPLLGRWTSTDATQSHTVRLTVGAKLSVDWGDGTVDIITGTGADQTVTHNYSVAWQYTQTWRVEEPGRILIFKCGANALTGNIPPLLKFTSLLYFWCQTNLLSGGLPTFIPSLTYFLSSGNNLTGIIPSLSSMTSLAYFTCYNNSLTGYTPSIISLSCSQFNASSNLLPQTAIDQILADFETNINSRVAVCGVSLGGAYNGAPSAAGLASKAAILAAKPGWTITHNTMFAQFNSADLTQSTTIRVTAGVSYWIDWGDGTKTAGTGNGADQVIAHNYAAPGTYTQKWYIQGPENLIRFQPVSNGLVGNIPSLAAFTNITYALFNVNQLTGGIPNLSTCTALVAFRCYTNPSLGGTIPSLSANTALLEFNAFDCGLSGVIPSLTANTLLQTFACHTNQITNYTASTLAASLNLFVAQNNLLPQSAIDQILADFATNVAARPATGTITLGGTGNAAPSAAGLASKAAILAAKPGWTITHN